MNNVVCVDMDGVLADFDRSPNFDHSLPIKFQIHKMYEPGFFFNLKPLAGSLVGVRAIMRMGYDVHILSRPVAESAHSYTEKVHWLGVNFPELITKINFAQEKGFFRADYLIDDDADKWKAKWEATGSKFYHFDSRGTNDTAQVELWAKAVEFFRGELSK